MRRQWRQYDIGVLFVHGIGSQREGATLLSGGEALHEWLALWITGGVLAKGSWGADLFPRRQGEQAPAHARMTFTTADSPSEPLEEHNLLFAESWWAEEFIPPGFRRLMVWALWVFPWVLSQHYGRQLLRGWLRMKRSDRFRRSAAAALQVAWQLLLLISAYAAMAPLVVFVVLLALVGAIPINIVRRTVLGIQRTLTSGIGDSFVLLTSPIQEAAIVERVRRDLEWVAQRSKRVAVVAHSQGAAIVHRLLRDKSEEGDLQSMVAPIPGELDLVISLGAGVHKLEDLDASRDKAHNRKASALPVMPTPYYGLLGFWTLVWALVVDASGGTKGVVAVIGLVMLGSAVYQATRQTTTYRKLMIDRSYRWIDLYAARDPVPNGPILEAGRPRETVEDLLYESVVARSTKLRKGQPRSFAISNRRSILGDHTGYWKNTEEAMTSVAMALGELGPETSITPARWRDRAPLLLGPVRRRLRLAILTAARFLAVASGVAVVAGLWMRDRIEEATVGTRRVAANAAELIPTVAVDELGPEWSWAAAVLQGLLVAAAAFSAISIVFAWWEKQESKYVFRREGYLALPTPMLLIGALAIFGLEVGIAIGIERTGDITISVLRAAVAALLAAFLAWFVPMQVLTGSDDRTVPTQALRNMWWSNNRSFGIGAFVFVVSFPAALADARTGGGDWVATAMSAAVLAVLVGLAGLAPFTTRPRFLGRTLTSAGEPLMRVTTRTESDDRERWTDTVARAEELRELARFLGSDPRVDLYRQATLEVMGRKFAADVVGEMARADLDDTTQVALRRSLGYFDVDVALDLSTTDPMRVECLERRADFGSWLERRKAKRALAQDSQVMGNGS